VSITNIILKQHTNNNYLEMQELYTVMITKVVRQRWVIRITIELNGAVRMYKYYNYIQCQTGFQILT